MMGTSMSGLVAALTRGPCVWWGVLILTPPHTLRGCHGTAQDGCFCLLWTVMGFWQHDLALKPGRQSTELEECSFGSQMDLGLNPVTAYSWLRGLEQVA